MSKTSLSGAFGSAILLLSTVVAMPAEPRRPQSTPVRPKITGVAAIAVKTKDMAAARNFYSTILGLDQAFATRNPLGGADFTTFKINERQYVYVSPGLKDDADSRLWFVSFETTDARALRAYLASRGLSVPATVDPDPEGNLSFIVKDPEGQDVQFIQYMPASVHGRNAGRFLSSRRLSDEALHVGYRIHDADKVDTFYKDILGFRLMWKGGSTENQFRWISMVVPDGTEWLEYMVDTGTPSPRTLGIWNHLAFSTLDQQPVAAEVKARGYAAAATPKIGRDGRWLMDLYDADLTRVEFMVRKPVQTPCCSPLVDPADRPGAAGGPVGIFEAHRDIGTPATIGGGSTTYDDATKSYTVRGGGENMWARADHFQFAWTKRSGDVSFSATIRFAGTEPASGTPDQHRKACLLLRQTLDDDASYVDAATHGNGMTALQWRASKGDLSHDIETNVVGPSRVRIDKRGDSVSMFVAEPGQAWRPAGGSTRVHLTGEYYIGIGVSSHAATRIDTATFSDIVIETPAPLTKASLVSTVETISLNSRDRRVAYVVTQPDPVQAPIWLPDGTSMLVFRSGKKAMKVLADLPRAPVNSAGPRIPEPLVGAAPPAAPGRPDDRTHVAPDGTVYFESDRGGSLQIWRMKGDGSAQEQVTTDAANWSPQITPDGKFLVFLTTAAGTDRRNRFDVTLRRMNLADRSIEDLTAFLGGRGSVGATAVAPTGQHLGFVSYQLVPR